MTSWLGVFTVPGTGSTMTVVVPADTRDQAEVHLWLWLTDNLKLAKPDDIFRLVTVARYER